MKKLAILISHAGTGSNLKAIIDGIENKKIAAEIAVVVSDNPDAPGLTYAKQKHTPAHIFNAKKETLEELATRQFPVDYLVLAGWKKIITNKTLKAFPDRIFNIHPGLIPDTLDGIVKNPDNTNALWNRGKFMTAAMQNFLDTKATYAGSTVHFLSDQFDFGKVLARCFEEIKADDTVESLYSRLKKKENSIYITALQTVLSS